VQRNGRFVLPVKNTYKRQGLGIVHDQSNTGRTVYIEPVEVSPPCTVCLLLLHDVTSPPSPPLQQRAESLGQPILTYGCVSCVGFGCSCVQVIEPTNDLKRLELELQQEEARIIGEMSRLVAISEVQHRKARVAHIADTP
jgi:hypothetical protein